VGSWKCEVGSWKMKVGRWEMEVEISKLFVLKNNAVAQIAMKILFLFSLKRKRL
jgi:hypothetical protein